MTKKIRHKKNKLIKLIFKSSPTIQSIALYSFFLSSNCFSSMYVTIVEKRQINFCFMLTLNPHQLIKMMLVNYLSLCSFSKARLRKCTDWLAFILSRFALSTWLFLKLESSSPSLLKNTKLILSVFSSCSMEESHTGLEQHQSE